VSEDYKGAPASPGVGGPEGLREMSVYLLTMGIALILLGAVAIGSSFVATIATVMVFGILLLVGAIFEVVTAFWCRCWRGFFLHLLAGILYLVAGLFMVDNPVGAAISFTLLVAACLVVGGILRTVVSLVERFEGWGWTLLNGIVSLLLGMAIWKQWPFSGLWVIGLFVGIEMLFSGLSWLMLGLAVRSPAKAALSAPAKAGLPS
jgi:uncharacterized membrane protein HdeD (DUF308 family)